MSDTIKSCPKCGAAIPAEAPQGLCPKCLLVQASFPTETGPGTRHSRPTPPARDDLIEAFPHLEILELIGQGGMGFVYKARQPKLDRHVALKILAQPLAEQTSFAERFTREGRTLAKLNHPNIVTIHDFGQAGPFFYLLMEYVDGVNLRQAMRAGAFNSTQALAIVPRICDALQYAHNEGVLHRDIKPDNILLDTRGRVKIADFGIAKLMAETVAENPLTGSGSTLGTPHYMAPEQIERPNTVDHRADIFSLGVVFYEMLTGELPLGRFSAPSEKSDVDPRLDQIVFQTLEKHPDKRPQSADEVKTRVESITANSPSAAASNPIPRVAIKSQRCYITTPEYLQTFFGKTMLYTGRGQLRLDEENLIFTHADDSVVIPLRAITHLSIGEFSRWAKPSVLNYISVTFMKGAAPSRVFLIPNNGGFKPTWDTNVIVRDWFDSIRAAVRSKTGRLPESTQEDSQPLPKAVPPPFGRSLAKAFATIALLLAAIALAPVLLYLLFARRPERPTDIPVAVSTLSAANELSRQIQITDAFASNQVHFAALVATEPRAGEQFIPVIRYAGGPWGHAVDATSAQQTWTTSEGRDLYSSQFTWKLPQAFATPFEVAAAVLRTRVLVKKGPWEIHSETITPIFAITNATGQSIYCGLQFAQQSPEPARPAKLTLFRGNYDSSSGNTHYDGTSYANIPAGFRLQSTALEGDIEHDSHVHLRNGFLNFRWSVKRFASDRMYYGVSHEKLDIAPNVPFEVKSYTNFNGQVVRFLLELVPIAAQ